MASEALGADEPKERRKWGENDKVYTRRIRKKALNNDVNGDSITIPPAAITHPSVENGDNNADVAITTSSAAVNNNSNEKENNNQSDIVPLQSTQTLVTEEANSSQQQQTLSASNDSLSLNKQAEVSAPNGCVRVNGNGSFKPILTKVDDRVRINLKKGRPKNEIREIKRKLVNELDQVRGVVKRLEAEEVLLTGNSTSGAGGYNRSLYSMNDGRALMRVYSDVGSVAQYDSRPFRPLSVTIMENNHGIGELAEKEKRTPKANQYYQNSEFLLGKDRLPPEGSNKRLKSNGGKKHGRQAGHRFGADKYTSRAFKGCSNLLARLMKHKPGWVFNKPVDVEAFRLHDYHDIIKHPMDLGTIKSKLSKNLYKTPMEFAEDVKLTFHNAMTYNPKGHEVHVMAEELLKTFEEKWPAIELDYNLALRYELVHDMGLPTPTSRPPASEMRNLERPESTGMMHVDPKLKPNSGAGRTPVPKKPKAKDPHKRDMTYEEKQRLSTNLQSLPSEKLNDIVQIIKKRNSALSQHDDEIEVDIDNVDAETLWELDRFVSNFKKSMSKKKRRAELALQACTETTPPVPATNPIPAIDKSLEGSKIGEESAAVPSSDHGEREGNDVGRTSSSSSSSSDSGSSSSDSDSDSSSSNGSDGGRSPGT